MPSAVGACDGFLERVHARARQQSRTILFPEAHDPRTRAAVAELMARGSVCPVLVQSAGTQDAPEGVPVVAPDRDSRFEAVVQHLLARRGAKGLRRDDAVTLACDPLYFADSLVALGHADGCVAGAVHTTAEVVRAALWTVGSAPGVRTVSSAFYMDVHDFRGHGPEVLTFTDCAVVPEPTARQLADIALSAASDRRRIVGDEPLVAFLSYSTLGSAEGPSVVRIREALALVRDEEPGLAVSGELQADAALVPEVAQRKASGAATAGEANVLVFPSLDAGNLAYKLVQRLAGAVAIGPILQGLARPCSDLSRGATADDIVHVAAITALQATSAPRPSTAL